MTGHVTGTGGVALADVKKSIAIFTYKHSVFSLDMKTKVARHVPRIAFQHFNNISWFPAVVILTFFSWEPALELVLSLERVMRRRSKN